MLATIHPNSLTAYHATAISRASLENRILGLMADGKARRIVPADTNGL